MTIALDLIKKLREATGAGIMECRKALEKSNGNLEKATDYLKKTFAEIAEKKADRKTSQGVVESYIHCNGKIGAIVMLLCETDFVARTSDFKTLSHELCMQIASMNPKNIKELLAQPYIRDPKMTISDLVKEKSGKLGEKILVKQFTRLEI